MSNIEMGVIRKTGSEKDLPKRNKVHEKKVEISLPCLGVELRRYRVIVLL